MRNSENIRVLARDGIRIGRKLRNKPLSIIGIIVVFTYALTIPPPPRIIPIVLGISTVRPSVATNNYQPQSPYISDSVAPEISAATGAVFDLKTHTFLYEKNSHDKMLPASLTKIATAVTALQKCSADTILTVSDIEIDGSQMGLIEGEQISVKNLLYGLFLSSGNDAAKTLSDGCFSGETKKMNELAAFLHLTDTHFSGPTGLEETDHYMSAYDLTILSAYAYTNPLIREVSGETVITVASQDNMRWHTLKNIHPLVGKREGVVGLKTGWTENAGDCMVTIFTSDERSYIIAIMQSEDRKADTDLLINWAIR